MAPTDRKSITQIFWVGITLSDLIQIYCFHGPNITRLIFLRRKKKHWKNMFPDLGLGN